jgi:hypothetical protein
MLLIVVLGGALAVYLLLNAGSTTPVVQAKEVKPVHKAPHKPVAPTAPAHKATHKPVPAPVSTKKGYW